jgi:hypothetical protein
MSIDSLIAVLFLAVAAAIAIGAIITNGGGAEGQRRK